jgi:vacuolar-type H+-ATPase subunit D/Vma8
MSSSLNFIIKFDSIDGLKKGGRVIYERQTIGSVDDIVYTEQGTFLVNVSIEKEFAERATKSTVFVIDSENNESYVKLISADKPGVRLVDGETVNGSSQLEGITREFKNKLSDSVSLFAESINDLVAEIDEESMEKQIEYFERELDSLIVQASEMSETKKKSLNQEVIPLLEDKLDKFQQYLEEQDMEYEFKRLKKKFTELITKLN